MVANWVKVIGILIGGTVAAAAAAYVGGVFEPSQGSAAIEAAVQQPPAGQTGAAKDVPATGEAKADGSATGEEKAGGDRQQMASLPPSGEQPQAAEPSVDPAAEPDLVVPVFDLVRVEPDGSVVIAGNAAANSTVELIAGASVIGAAKAGPGGDFAVVLDDPLKPGDYTVVLRATGEDSVVTMSAQTAIIAVPETDNGQVLALVEEPGAPSRLITVPAAPKPKEEVEMAAKGDRPAAAKSEEGGQAAAAPEAQAGTETQAAAAEAPAQDSGAAPKVAEAAGTADAAQAEEKQVAVAEQPKTETPAPASAATRTARIAVEAVEIEGRKVFVAGRADAGKTVRVYANDILLGQAVTSEGGRFLIEAEKDLPVGDYIVRADMLSADNADVEARAAVPFEREPGEKLAAVAATESAQEETSDKTAEGAAMAKSEDAGAASQEQTTLSGDVAAKDGGGSAAKSETTEVAALDNGGGASASGGDARVAGDTKPDDAAKAADGGSMQAAVSEGGPSDSETDAVEATAPKLQNVGSAVIIRRGDTLWRLSRRVYGRGIRYTTIYLANEEQIADPDMIWPGQVFSVPSETDEGEAADMSAVAEQVAGPDAASENVATR